MNLIGINIYIYVLFLLFTKFLYLQIVEVGAYKNPY